MSFDQGRSRDVEAERGSGHRRARREKCAHPLACGGKRRDPTGTIDHDGPFRRGNRPLLKNDDPAAVLQRLMSVRYPIYAEADIIVDSRDAPAERTTDDVAAALAAFLQAGTRPTAAAGAAP